MVLLFFPWLYISISVSGWLDPTSDIYVKRHVKYFCVCAKLFQMQWMYLVHYSFCLWQTHSATSALNNCCPFSSPCTCQSVVFSLDPHIHTFVHSRGLYKRGDFDYNYGQICEEGRSSTEKHTKPRLCETLFSPVVRWGSLYNTQVSPSVRIFCAISVCPPLYCFDK